MHLTSIQRILGILLMVFSVTLIPPALVSLFYEDSELMPFLLAFTITLGIGFLFWLPVRNNKRELRLRDGFVVVVMFWTVLSAIGSLPFMFSQALNISVTDALFESISGLTTTGATVLTGLDTMPHSILFYRQQIQWMGGMGIIVLAVAVLPLLGIGGMQLYRAESPGPVKDNKLTPRITETAKALWYIYLGLTVACAMAYWIAGMNMFDAIGHAFSTVAIGGFSTHDASMGYFSSPAIGMVAIVFMFASGINFALHFVVARELKLSNYFKDAEFRFYSMIVAFVIIATVGGLYFSGTYPAFGDALYHGIFQAVSIVTTTGFTTSDYAAWPAFIAITLLLSSFIGGCAGSTGGGIKVIRFLLLIKQGAREIMRLIHPSALIPIRIGDKTVPVRVVEAVWGFFALYVASFVFMYLLLAATGIDLITAFSAVAASINNLGPGLADVSLNYGELHDPAKWVLCFAMLLGRLEIFTLLVLLSPAFWRS